MTQLQHKIYQIDAAQKDSAAVSTINEILQRALQAQASDIHLEPGGEGLVVKFRCHGQLQEDRVVISELEHLMLNRLKVMAEMDITEKRLPQDGHLAVLWKGQQYDLRISSLPLFQGEKMVVRILGQRENMKTLEQLGFSPENFSEVYDFKYSEK